MQQSLFVQQQMIQLATNEHQVNRKIPLSPWSINYISDEGKKKIDSLISDEQKELLKKTMKESNAQKEAKEKPDPYENFFEDETTFWDRKIT